MLLSQAGHCRKRGVSVCDTVGAGRDVVRAIADSSLRVVLLMGSAESALDLSSLCYP